MQNPGQGPRQEERARDARCRAQGRKGETACARGVVDKGAGRRARTRWISRGGERGPTPRAHGECDRMQRRRGGEGQGGREGAALVGPLLVITAEICVRACLVSPKERLERARIKMEEAALERERQREAAERDRSKVVRPLAVPSLRHAAPLFSRDCMSRAFFGWHGCCVVLSRPDALDPKSSFDGHSAVPTEREETAWVPASSRNPRRGFGTHAVGSGASRNPRRGFRRLTEPTPWVPATSRNPRRGLSVGSE